MSLMAALVLLAFVPAASAAEKFYSSTLGTTQANASSFPPSPAGSAFGGFFSTGNSGVGDIVVNDPAVDDGNGIDGWVYVADRGNNRIQAFDRDLNFKWAIGRDVIASQVNEFQLIEVDATAGNFTLTYDGDITDPLNWNASAAQVQAALRGLDSVPGADITVTGTVATATVAGRYAVSFTGAFAASDRPEITFNDSNLTGDLAVSTFVDGTASVPGDQGDVFEKCTVVGHCKNGATSALDGRGGEFNVLAGIDIDQSSGQLFVGERNANARVQQFEGDGTFIRAFGWDVVASGPGNDISPPINEFETCNAADGDVCKAGVTAQNLGTGNPGQFGSTTVATNGLAVAPPGAPNAGQVYVADPGSCRVQRFTAPSTDTGLVVAGTPFGTPPLAGNQADDVFCGTTGLPPVTAPGLPLDVAADARGVVYASSATGANGGMIKRFDTTASVTGSFLPMIGVGGGDNQLEDAGGAVRGLAVDPDSDHLLVARSNAGLGVVELDLTDGPLDVGPADVVGRHLVGMGATGMALGAGDGRYFLSTSSSVTGSGSGHRVFVLDGDGVEPDPLTTVNPATNVEATTATFSGRIDPVITRFFPTSYRWQVSKDGVSWTDLTSDVLVGGNGFTAQDVTTDATGLEPNTLYRVRIRTSRSPAAGLSFSSEMVVLTDPMRPVVQTKPAQRVSDSSARLLGSLNPGGLPTDYWFEWGDDNYGNRIPAISAMATGGLPRSVAERLSGLTPGRVYHYRLCAQNSLEPQKICGTDTTFTTAPAAVAPPGRSYEMVTAADKSSRRGAALTNTGYDFTRLQSGIASIDGSAFRASYFAQPADPDAAYGSAVFDTQFEIRTRASDGWSGEAVMNIPPTGSTSVTPFTNIGGVSGDLSVGAWGTSSTAMVGSSWLSVRKMGDSGGPRGAGWYPWLDPAWSSPDSLGGSFWLARFDDAGERMLAQSEATLTSLFRDVTPLDDTRSPMQLTPGQSAGRAVFVSDAGHDWRPADLVNECTGSGGSATLVPARDDGGTVSGPPGTATIAGAFITDGSVTAQVPESSAIKVGHFISGTGIPAGARVTAIGPADFGYAPVTMSLAATATQSVTVTIGQNTAALADDRISTRPCAEGSPTDVRGANVDPTGRLAGSSAMWMSDGGKRVFFVSPDPRVNEVGSACDVGDSATGAGTTCPPQLFVRQLDDDNVPTVRWLSRPEDALLKDGLGNPQMSPAALGSGVSFEGASRDGSVVYFRTDAPLTSDDPNGGLDPLQVASPNSWDLYRYDLGADNNADPGAGDSGPRLTRISGGPSGTADPNTNCTSVATAGPETGNCWGGENSAASNIEPNGAGSVVRHVSDDGERVYLVTAAQIPGADNSRPAGGATSPTGTGDQVNAATRNLYLHDSNRSGASAYKFIAQIPFTTGANRLDRCASAGGRIMGPQARTANGPSLRMSSNDNCVHGSGSGDGIVFATNGQLTLDDDDTAGDVYVYDADEDALMRLSSPTPGDHPYVCAFEGGVVRERCNGDLGFATLNAHPLDGPGMSGQRHWNVAQDGQGRLTDVYFESRLPLVAGDNNASSSATSGGMDVYRWRRSNRRLSLISPGSVDGTPAFYGGNSLDGRDVFFWTEQSLSLWEIDEGDGDIYNATTRAPLPGPPPPPTVCAVLADGCQGGGFGSVSTDTKTQSATESDNAKVEARKTLSLSGLSAKARRKAARTGRLTLRVRTSRAGVVRLTARAKLGKKVRRVGRVSKRATKAGTVRVNLRLNSVARKRLRSGRALRVTLRVASPGARTGTRSILLLGVRS